MMNLAYELYGLRVESEIDLPGVPVVTGNPDIRIELGAEASTDPGGVGGSVLAEFSYGPGCGYTLRSDGDGYLLSFNRLCDMVIARDCRHVRINPYPGADSELMPLVLAGNGLAFLLALRGEQPLHASAVEDDDGATAILAHPGGGKSTLAAFLCSRGARLVTDDVLLLDGSEEGARCRYGGCEVRLRAGSVMLDTLNAPSRRTADDRTAFWLAGARPARPVLRRIIFPRLSRSASRMRIRRLPSSGALQVLLNNPKVSGWSSKGPLRRRFQQLAHVAAGVPAYEAEIPWGAPLTDELADALLGRLATDTAAS
jgi:hypothetical protein